MRVLTVNSHTQVGLHVAFLVSIFFLSISCEYENSIYDRLVKNALPTSGQASEEDAVLGLLHAAHSLMRPHTSLLHDDQNGTLRETLLPSADLTLLDGGPCGSHSFVLTRMLQRAGFTARIAQMRCADLGWGCHIVVEARLSDDWAVLDPLFDLHYRNANGTLASAAEIGRNWEYFSRQVPDHYDQSRDFRGVRYTNWSKLPLLTKPAAFLVGLLTGENPEEVSIRSYLLNVHQVYLYVLAPAYVLLCFITILALHKKRVQEHSRSE
jgi:hypothetical protein